MATKKEKGDQVEVMFTDNITLDGRPYVMNKPYTLDREQAEAVFASGHAIEYTEELAQTEERRKMLPQNRPLKESDVVIATHDSGEQVAYKDNREKGPLDSRPTPTTPISPTEARALGASREAVAIAEARNKGAKGGRRVEELPVGDLPTGVPVGVMEASQAATKSLKANTSSGIEVDTERATKAREKAAGADEDDGGSKKSKK